MDISKVSMIIRLVSAVLSIAGALALLFFSKPLNISKRPEDGMFRQLCFVTAVFGFFSVIKNLQRIYMLFPFNSIFGLLALYLPDLIFIFYVLLWRLFVDVSINGSIKRVKLRFRNAIIPFGILIALLCVAFYLLQLANRDIIRRGQVSDMVDKMYTSWRWVYYITGLSLVVYYLAVSFYNLYYYHKTRKQPLFLRLDVFIIPWIVAIVVQNIPPLYLVIDSLCAFISLLLTYYSMRNRYRYLDLQTDFYREDFIPFLEKYAIENNLDKNCSIIRITCSDFLKGADIIRKSRPLQSIVIEMEEGDFLMIAAINMSNAFLLLDNCLKETAQREYPEIRIDTQYWIKEPSESLEDFARRTLSECRKRA